MVDFWIIFTGLFFIAFVFGGGLFIGCIVGHGNGYEDGYKAGRKRGVKDWSGDGDD